MKNNKQELINEAARLGNIHQQKKNTIEKIFSDLDKEEKTTFKHLNGISAVNELLKELEEIEIKHQEIIDQIKKN